MYVQMWMTYNPITIEPDNKIATAAAIMSAESIRHLPVLARGSDRIRGVITISDIARACPMDVRPLSSVVDKAVGARAVSEVMTQEVTVVGPSLPLEEAARRLARDRSGCLMVVQSDELVGIVTQSDICRALVATLGDEDETVQIVFEMNRDSGSFSDLVGLVQAAGMEVLTYISWKQDTDRLCMVRLTSGKTEDLVGSMWEQGFRVRRVLTR